MKNFFLRIFIFLLEIIYWSLMGFCAVVEWFRENPGRTPEERLLISIRTQRETRKFRRLRRRMGF